MNVEKVQLTSMNTPKTPSSDYYIAPSTKRALFKAKNLVKNHDFDRVYLIDGTEGSGKSLLALQLAYECNNNLSLDKICFNGQQFSDGIDKAQKNDPLIFDEAFNGLASTGATSTLNRLIVRKLMECRQKNLFIFVVLPTIFMLQKYAAIFRTKALFHVYITKNGVRGYYKTYNESNKKKLFLLGHKMYSYSKPFIKKSQRFYGKYPIDEMAYRKKKLLALSDNMDEVKSDKYFIRSALLSKLLKEKYKFSYRGQAKYLQANGHDITHATMTRNVLKYAKNPKM